MFSENNSHTSPFAAHQHLLSERLHILLKALHPALQADTVLALKGKGKLLSDVAIPPEAGILPNGAWPLLTLLITQHIAPDIALPSASTIAIATECFICALDLLDDVEDDDPSHIVKELGPARTLNVSTVLLGLTQRAILSAANKNIPSSITLRLLDELQQTIVIATGGQHRDLLAEHVAVDTITSDECIEVARAKAGALTRFACCAGVVCADGEAQMYEQFSELGELLGIAHQLDNDCHDLYHLLQGEFSASEGSGTAQSAAKSDLIRGKKTLPIVLAAQKGYILQNINSLTDEGKSASLRALQEGLLSAWGTCMLYRLRAREVFQRIEAQGPVSPGLRLLFELA